LAKERSVVSKRNLVDILHTQILLSYSPGDSTRCEIGPEGCNFRERAGRRGISDGEIIVTIVTIALS